METPRDGDLQHHFEQTRYVSEFGTIHVDQELPVGLLQWMDDKRVTTLAVLGAENPQGAPATQAANEEAHARLLTELDLLGCEHCESTGELDDWSEGHVTVIGISLDRALHLARAFDQAAIVWCERDGVAELVWT